MFIYYSEEKNRRIAIPKVAAGGTHHIELIAIQDISVSGPLMRLYTGIWIYPDTLNSMVLSISDAGDPRFFVHQTYVTLAEELNLVLTPLSEQVQVCTGDIIAFGTYLPLGINESITVMRQPMNNLLALKNLTKR